MSSCSYKQPSEPLSATILIKTPKLKFYDKGFITKYNNYIKVEILQAGTNVLNLDIYDYQVCVDTFKCQSSKNFNKEFLDSSYDDDFLKKLFNRKEKNIVFKDKKNNILIKIKKD